MVLLPSLKPACSSPMIFCLWLLQLVQYDLLYDFAWVSDEAGRSIILTLLQVAFLGRCDD